MKLSFVIPIYNPRKNDILRCLDSIYTTTPSNIQPSDYQIVCINDFSSETDGIEAIESYIFNGSHPGNLLIVHHKENLRQGGARNTGIKVALGDYIQFVDQDDFLSAEAFQNIIDAISKHYGTDLIMFDYSEADNNGNITDTGYYTQRNHTKPISGGNFLKTQEVPWTPWSYLYRREFLLHKCLRFPEKTRFEDVDFVLKATILARQIVFIPHANIIHTHSGYQISSVGNSKEIISEMYYLCYRMGLLAKESFANNLDGADVIFNHYIFAYKSHIKRYMWRLPYRRIVSLLKEHPFIEGHPLPKSVRIVMDHPKLTAKVLVCARPSLLLAHKLLVHNR